MVLGIVDENKTEKENSVETKVDEIKTLEIEKFKAEVQDLKSGKGEMEQMVIEMRNHLKEMQVSETRAKK